LAFWNAVTAFCVSAPKTPSGRLVPFFVEIGIAKPRSISASCSTCTPSPWEPRRSGGLFVEARTMSGSLEKRAHWRAMAHPLSGRGMMAHRLILTPQRFSRQRRLRPATTKEALP
jgi:hypothetical protein